MTTCVLKEAFVRHMLPLARSHPDLFPEALFIAQEWQWVVTVIWSRSFSHQESGQIDVHSRATQVSLVPILDMANHQPTTEKEEVSC